MNKKYFPLTLLLAVAIAQLFGFLTYSILGSHATSVSHTPPMQQVDIELVLSSQEITITPSTKEVPKQTEFLPYDVPLAADIQEYIYQKCSQTEIPFELVLAIIKCESNFIESEISETDDYGLMQINEFNHEWLSEELGITDFLNPKQNIDAGVFILNDLFNKEADLSKVLMMYNCGPSGAKRLWDKGIYSTSYTKKVMEQMETLEQEKIK